MAGVPVGVEQPEVEPAEVCPVVVDPHQPPPPPQQHHHHHHHQQHQEGVRVDVVGVAHGVVVRVAVGQGDHAGGQAIAVAWCARRRRCRWWWVGSRGRGGVRA